MASLITVSRRFLQGDSLSPLLFNLVIKTFINTIKQVKINCMGYAYDGTLASKHWMQFADDTELVTSLESDNQYLCNAFVKWSSYASSYAGLIVKVTKCHVFGIKKVKTDIIQYQLYITTNKVPIPPVRISKNYAYLGKDINISMDCGLGKQKLIKDVSCYLKKTDKLLPHPLQKIQICQLYIFSELE